MGRQHRRRPSTRPAAKVRVRKTIGALHILDARGVDGERAAELCVTLLRATAEELPEVLQVTVVFSFVTVAEIRDDWLTHELGFDDEGMAMMIDMTAGEPGDTLLNIMTYDDAVLVVGLVA